MAIHFLAILSLLFLFLVEYSSIYTAYVIKFYYFDSLITPRMSLIDLEPGNQIEIDDDLSDHEAHLFSTENGNDEDNDMPTKHLNKYEKRRANKYSEFNDIIQEKYIDLSDFERRDASLTSHDIYCVSRQLGYLPYNIVRIAATDINDVSHHLVAVLYPLNRNRLKGKYEHAEGYKPFPTIYWMISPSLQAKVSFIERDGWIQKLQARLLDSEEYLEIMRQSHQLYREERWNMLSPSDKDYIEQMGWFVPFHDVITCVHVLSTGRELFKMSESRE